MRIKFVRVPLQLTFVLPCKHWQCSLFCSLKVFSIAIANVVRSLFWILPFSRTVILSNGSLSHWICCILCACLLKLEQWWKESMQPMYASNHSACDREGHIWNRITVRARRSVAWLGLAVQSIPRHQREYFNATLNMWGSVVYCFVLSLGTAGSCVD